MILDAAGMERARARDGRLAKIVIVGGRDAPGAADAMWDYAREMRRLVAREAGPVIDDLLRARARRAGG